MKKTTMMRIATTLLVAVLVTTCALGATFAKYVTEAEGADQATVAQFGVKIEVADDMGVFKTEYATENTDYTGSVTVKSNASVGDNTDNRVAPGTAGSMTFTITGTPEVATKTTVIFTGTAIQLAAGTYTLGAGEYANGATEYTTTAVYEPIKFYFGTKAVGDLTAADYALTLADLEEALEDLTVYGDPNVALDVTYTIAWVWDFEGEFKVGETNVADFLDTYLAQNGTRQTEDIKIEIRVEQVN